MINRVMKPIIAITMGDPCGIGPEVIVKGLLDEAIYDVCRPFVIGNAGRMAEVAALFASSLAVRPIKAVDEARFTGGSLDVLDDLQESLPPHLHFGKPHPLAASAAMRAMNEAVQLALRKEIDGITTAPIHKEQMKAIGFSFPGHTEFFAKIAGTDRFGMMMVGGGLKIMLATIHLPLKKAIEHLKRPLLLESIRLTAMGLKRDFGCPDPQIAVAALNPHAGEAGIFGDEEEREVIPAVKSAQAEGINVSGPYPADTLFHQLRQDRFDAAVALFHDQALIPIKLLAFGRAINVTVGLPFIRTSVDHGTAYDIAGRGTADPRSLQEAVKLAAQMAQHRYARVN
ncbi:MAG: 4-hydroxythreonine-4-phosphate dehydrogenase PdxA [Nitrospiria bacterium]